MFGVLIAWYSPVLNRSGTAVFSADVSFLLVCEQLHSYEHTATFFLDVRCSGLPKVTLSGWQSPVFRILGVPGFDSGHWFLVP